MKNMMSIARALIVLPIPVQYRMDIYDARSYNDYSLAAMREPDSMRGTPMTKPPAVVLLSGGLDSTTVLAIAKDQGFEPYALTFRYGQRHEGEIQAATRVAQRDGVTQHVIVDIDLRLFGGSALTSDIPVPKGRAVDEMDEGIPITYVPARNTIFLSFALAWAEVLGSSDIFIGVNALDYSGYPDCRPEYIEAYQRMANLATKAGIEGRQRLTIHTPLIALSKARIIREGLRLNVDYGITLTCYDPTPDGRACGSCDACTLRQKGFAENGMEDPALLAAEIRSQS
jgi:7-cyano-7-deazaguanine synthase